MSTHIEFDVPSGMKPETVAGTLAAYLIGASAFQGKGRGPFQVDMHGKIWQLDGTRDFFLNVEEGDAVLNCRHEGDEEKIIATMVQLFELRYPKDRSARAAA